MASLPLHSAWPSLLVASFCLGFDACRPLEASEDGTSDKAQPCAEGGTCADTTDLVACVTQSRLTLSRCNGSYPAATVKCGPQRGIRADDPTLYLSIHLPWPVQRAEVGGVMQELHECATKYPRLASIVEATTHALKNGKVPATSNSGRLKYQTLYFAKTIPNIYLGPIEDQIRNAMQGTIETQAALAYGCEFKEARRKSASDLHLDFSDLSAEAQPVSCQPKAEDTTNSLDIDPVQPTSQQIATRLGSDTSS